jgi:hypothetical protein
MTDLPLDETADCREIIALILRRRNTPSGGVRRHSVRTVLHMATTHRIAGLFIFMIDSYVFGYNAGRPMPQPRPAVARQDVQPPHKALDERQADAR